MRSPPALSRQTVAPPFGGGSLATSRLAELSRRGAVSPTTAVPQPDRRWASSRHGERRNGPADMSRGTGAVCD